MDYNVKYFFSYSLLESTVGTQIPFYMNHLLFHAAPLTTLSRLVSHHKDHKKVLLAGAGRVLQREIKDNLLERYDFTESSINCRFARDSWCFCSC